MSASVAVLSDAHLGDPNSRLEQAAMQSAVVATLQAREAATLVLLGDTLDLDFGTLVTGVEGRLHGDGRLTGLRALLNAICAKTQVQEIVYVPGNHDYAIWNWEATWRNALEPLARGATLTGGVQACGVVEKPFLAGLLPESERGRFTLVYPDYHVKVAGRDILLTHGHYLDRKQTEGIALTDILKKDCDADRQEFREDVFKASAQYQDVAHALAVGRAWRVDSHRVYGVVTHALDEVCRIYDWLTNMRGKPLAPEDLPAIACYLKYFAAPPVASAFVYGHTHVPGRWDTPNGASGVPSTPVYNSGSFIPPDDLNSSMLFLSEEKGALAVDLVGFPKATETTVTRLS